MSDGALACVLLTWLLLAAFPTLLHAAEVQPPSTAAITCMITSKMGADVLRAIPDLWHDSTLRHASAGNCIGVQAAAKQSLT